MKIFSLYYLKRLKYYAGLIYKTANQMDDVANQIKHVKSRVEEIHQYVDNNTSTKTKFDKDLPETPMRHDDNPHVNPDSFPIPKFWEPNYWEPTVQVALRDYCRPGDVVFDVGANAGALSLAMSRHVGPRGIVCAFEASPRIIDKTNYNLVNAGCNNVFLYHRAIYHTSYEYVTLYPGTHLNDSIYDTYCAEGEPTYEVETITLDDFVDASGLMPSFIKMDIEGAEFDALQGSTSILKNGKPGLILEQTPNDMRCYELLTKAGYLAINLANYKHIKSAEDLDKDVSVLNVLFIHKDKAEKDPYLNAGEPVEVAKLPKEAFVQKENGDISLDEKVELPPGRYICMALFSAKGTDNEIFAGIDTERGREMRYHTNTKLMVDSYRSWVFSLKNTCKITPYIQFISGKDETLDWQGAVIYRYDNFNSVTPPVIF